MFFKISYAAVCLLLWISERKAPGLDRLNFVQKHIGEGWTSSFLRRRLLWKAVAFHMRKKHESKVHDADATLTFGGCWQWLFFGCGRTSDAKLYEIFFPALHHQIIKILSSYNLSVRHKNQTFMFPHRATCLQECGVCWGYWLYASLRETAKRR